MDIKNKSKNLASFFSLYCGIPIPYFIFYLSSLGQYHIQNPFNESAVIASLSLSWSDFFKVLPHNFIYPRDEYQVSDVNFWSWQRKNAFLGLTPWLLALLGFFQLKKTKQRLFTYLSSVLFFGFFLALGPFFYSGKITIQSPLNFLYQLVPFFSFIRVPLRGFFLTSFAVSLLSAFGLKYLLTLIRHRSKFISYFLLVSIVLVFLFESVPFPYRRYAMRDYLSLKNYDENYLQFLEKSPKDLVLLELPSFIDFAFERSHLPLFDYNREVIYMNWQTQHRRNIVNGVNGYFPESRLELQNQMMQFPSVASLEYLKQRGVKLISYHKDLLLPGEKDLLPMMKKSPNLKLSYETVKTAIFVFLPRP